MNEANRKYGKFLHSHISLCGCFVKLCKCKILGDTWKLESQPIGPNFTNPRSNKFNLCNWKKGTVYILGQSPSQSVPTILVLKNRVGLWTWKKPGPKYGVQKAGCKKQGQCYSKREKARLSLLFLNNNDPAFCTLLFATYFFGPFFLSFRT